MKLGTGRSARTNQFCLMKLPVLAHLSTLNHIDYLGALLNALPYSRYELTIARRARIAGYSKFSFFDHAFTAAVIVSWQPRLCTSLHYLILLLLLVLGFTAVMTADTIAIILLTLLALVAQLWHALLVKILFKRSVVSPLVFNEQVEEVRADKNRITTIKLVG